MTPAQALPFPSQNLHPHKREYGDTALLSSDEEDLEGLYVIADADLHLRPRRRPLWQRQLQVRRQVCSMISRSEVLS